MQTNAQLAERERQRGDLLKQAAEVVQSATAASRNLTENEDRLVLELVKQARAIEEEILRSKRHHV
jgi:hypothetical protein